MFSTEQYQQRHQEMKEEIEQDSDKGWLRTVNQRYGAFLAGNAERAIALSRRGLSVIVDDAMEQPHRDHFAGELMSACSTLHAASSLIRGAVIVPNPLDVEAIMRLYALDNTPKESGAA